MFAGTSRFRSSDVSRLSFDFIESVSLKEEDQGISIPFMLLNAVRIKAMSDGQRVGIELCAF